MTTLALLNPELSARGQFVKSEIVRGQLVKLAITLELYRIFNQISHTH